MRRTVDDYNLLVGTTIHLIVDRPEPALAEPEAAGAENLGVDDVDGAEFNAGLDDEEALATAIARSQRRGSDPPVPDPAPEAEAEVATEAEAEAEAEAEVEAQAEAEAAAEPQPQPQQPEGQPSPSSTQGLLCSGCSQPQPKAAFSKNQASKPAHKRRCKQCVAAGAMSPPGLQAREVLLQPEPEPGSLFAVAGGPGAAAAPVEDTDGRGVREEATRLCNMAVQHCQQGRFEQARPLLERALEVDPRHVDSLHNLGALHFEQGRHDEAQPLLERVLVVDPRHVESLCSLGTLHFNQGRLEEAWQLWERLLEDDPRHVETLISLGNLHSQQGRPEEARSLWEQTWDPALRAGPV